MGILPATVPRWLNTLTTVWYFGSKTCSFVKNFTACELPAVLASAVKQGERVRGGTSELASAPKVTGPTGLSAGGHHCILVLMRFSFVFPLCLKMPAVVPGGVCKCVESGVRRSQATKSPLQLTFSRIHSGTGSKPNVLAVSQKDESFMDDMLVSTSTPCRAELALALVATKLPRDATHLGLTTEVLYADLLRVRYAGDVLASDGSNGDASCARRAPVRSH